MAVYESARLHLQAAHPRQDCIDYASSKMEEALVEHSETPVRKEISPSAPPEFDGTEAVF